MDPTQFNSGMEGEGNKTADKQYRERASDYAKSGKVDQAAKEAERDVETDPAQFDAAAKEGQSHSAGDSNRDLSGETEKTDADLDDDEQ
ncbi:MAG: hypothetical protein JST54_27045 [Deltaproteobacteria bacterium]|nr:hypothetical protein [Deltaproteobacteria bacterium]